MKVLPIAAASLGLLIAGCGTHLAGPTGGNTPAIKSITGLPVPNGAPGSSGQGYLSAGGLAQAAPQQADATQANPVAIVIGTPKGKVSRSVDAAYQCDSGKFQDSFNKVMLEATTLGGYVATSDTQPDDSGRIASGSVTVKVPADQLEALVAFLGTEFQLSSINFSTDDQTGKFVDLSARLAAAQKHEAALQDLLSKATTIADISNIEDKIAQVQTEEEDYQGQIKAINDQVDYATANITINEKGVALTTPSPIWSALTTGWNNLVSEASGLIASLVTLLPLIVIGLVVWKRRKRFSNPSSPATPGTPAETESVRLKNPGPESK